MLHRKAWSYRTSNCWCRNRQRSCSAPAGGCCWGSTVLLWGRRHCWSHTAATGGMRHDQSHKVDWYVFRQSCILMSLVKSRWTSWQKFTAYKAHCCCTQHPQVVHGTKVNHAIRGMCKWTVVVNTSVAAMWGALHKLWP